MEAGAAEGNYGNIAAAGAEPSRGQNMVVQTCSFILEEALGRKLPATKIKCPQVPEWREMSTQGKLPNPETMAIYGVSGADAGERCSTMFRAAQAELKKRKSKSL